MELEEQRAKEALVRVPKKHKLMKLEGVRVRARTIAEIGGDKNNESMVWRPRPLFFWLVFFVIGPQHR